MFLLKGWELDAFVGLSNDFFVMNVAASLFYGDLHQVSKRFDVCRINDLRRRCSFLALHKLLDGPDNDSFGVLVSFISQGFSGCKRALLSNHSEVGDSRLVRVVHLFCRIQFVYELITELVLVWVVNWTENPLLNLVAVHERLSGNVVFRVEAALSDNCWNDLLTLCIFHIVFRVVGHEIFQVESFRNLPNLACTPIFQELRSCWALGEVCNVHGHHESQNGQSFLKVFFAFQGVDLVDKLSRDAFNDVSLEPFLIENLSKHWENASDCFFFSEVWTFDNVVKHVFNNCGHFFTILVGNLQEWLRLIESQLLELVRGYCVELFCIHGEQFVDFAILDELFLLADLARGAQELVQGVKVD